MSSMDTPWRYAAMMVVMYSACCSSSVGGWRGLAYSSNAHPRRAQDVSAPGGPRQVEPERQPRNGFVVAGLIAEGYRSNCAMRYSTLPASWRRRAAWWHESHRDCDHGGQPFAAVQLPPHTGHVHHVQVEQVRDRAGRLCASRCRSQISAQRVQSSRPPRVIHGWRRVPLAHTRQAPGRRPLGSPSIGTPVVRRG